MSSSMRLNALRKSLVSRTRKPPVSSASSARPPCESNRIMILGPLDDPHHRLIGVFAATSCSWRMPLLARLLDLPARIGRAADRAQPGGVDGVDGDVRAVGGFDHRAEVRLQRRRRRQALGEEDHRLAARQLVERLQDREQRLGRAEAALIAVHRVERLQHPHLALDEAPLQVESGRVPRGAADGRRPPLLLRPAAARLRLERSRAGRASASIASRCCSFDSVPAGMTRRTALRTSAGLSVYGLEDADERLGREDTDAGVGVAAHRQVLERGLLAHADGVGRERVEDERGHRRVLVVVERRRLRRRRPGRRRDDGRADWDPRSPTLTPMPPPARHARERAELLHDVVLAQLEVLGRRDRSPACRPCVADDDVDQDGGGDRGEVGRGPAPGWTRLIAGGRSGPGAAPLRQPGRARRRRRIVGTSRHQPEGELRG